MVIIRDELIVKGKHMNTSEKQTTKYPEWPLNFTGPKPGEALFTKITMGRGLLESDILPLDLSGGPHPEQVKQWRKDRQATVAKTAAHFGLTDVQVLEACR
jgi:hypothetical protein